MAGFIYWFLVVSTLAAAVLAALTWRQQPARGARYFTVAIVGVAWWLGCIVGAYTVWLDGGSIHVINAFKRFKWVGIFLIAGGIYAFGMAYTNRDRFLRPRILAGLAVVPVVVVFGDLFSLTLLDPYVPGFLADVPLIRDMNLWRIVGSGYVYLLLFVGTVALFSMMVSHRLTEPTQVGLWALAIGVPWTVNVGYVIGLIPLVRESGFWFNPTPIGYLVTIVAGFVAIVRYDAFQISPIARAYVVDQIEESVVVYDDQYRMLDYNESAAALLEVSQQDLREDVRTVLARSDLPVSVPDGNGSTDDFGAWIDGRELTLEAGGESVVLTGTVAPLAGRSENRNESTDYALVLQDVTERARREDRLRTQNEQLQLLNRIVHHDIRNDMNLVLELLRHLDRAEEENETTERESEKRRYLETLIESSEHVVELTETAHTLTNAVSKATEERKPVALAPILRREVANAAGLSRDATVRIENEIPDVDVLANEMLASVFRNLLTNAIQHNDADEPTVTVRATLVEDTAQITIADNGPGLPKQARETLVADENTPAKEGGIGLTLVKTLVDQYGGRLSLDRNNPHGTVVTVELGVSQ
jgi:signal transduction histidine kinase